MNRVRPKESRVRAAESSRLLLMPFTACFLLFFMLFNVYAFAEELKLQEIIDESLKNNHDIKMADARWKTSLLKVPQAKSLPDPMIMLGYQNEGWRRYTYGEMEGAQWMFSVSQMLPYPGKLALKGEMVSRDSESLSFTADTVRLRTISRVKELYFDLLLVYTIMDLINEKAVLFEIIEDAATSRYSSGMARQQDVLMAQTEKYMLLEKEEMFRQKIQSIEAMLNSVIGRDVNSVISRPSRPAPSTYSYSMDEFIRIAHENSPEIKSREMMIASSETRVLMAEKEYYPDLTLAASLYKRSGGFDDMWSLTTSINIPVFYRTKQRQAVNEAKSVLAESRHELEAAKLMISSAIKDNFSMIKASERLVELYKSALIPKTYQDFEAALAGYVSGRVEAMTVIGRLKSLIDYETLYWGQFVEREKAIARLDAIIGRGAEGSK